MTSSAHMGVWAHHEAAPVLDKRGSWLLPSSRMLPERRGAAGLATSPASRLSGWAGGAVFAAPQLSGGTFGRSGVVGRDDCPVLSPSRCTRLMHDALTGCQLAYSRDIEEGSISLATHQLARCCSVDGWGR